MSVNLGQGGILDSLTITPVFAGGGGSAKLNVPDELFPQIKGGLRYSSGSNPDAKTLGSTAMGATAKGTIRGANFVVGFKQVANFKFLTALYAGVKDGDGSIEESSTGLNFRSFLDCAPNENLQSPQAPFYLPRIVAPNGKEFTTQILDQPAGRLRLQRRNSIKDRLNFLVGFRTRTDFLTYFVVEMPDGSHLPVEGFRWRYEHEVIIAWPKGSPTIQRNNGGAAFDTKVQSLPASDPAFAILTNTSLTSADTIVTQFNRGMFAAQNKQPSGDYAITEFPNYTGSFTAEMLRAVPEP